MTYQEFAQRYRDSSLRATVNRSSPHYGIVLSQLPPRYIAAYKFWPWVSYAAILGGMGCFFVSIWLAIVVVVVGLLINASATKSGDQFIVQHAAEDAAYFNMSCAMDVVRV